MMSSKIKTIAGLLDAAATRAPSRLALVSPLQKQQSYTYEQLALDTNAVAGFLNLYGFEKNDLLVSDLPNTTENLIVQLACNRMGVAYTTAKDLEGMARYPKIKGAICTDPMDKKGFLSQVVLPLPTLFGDFVENLINEDLDQYRQESVDTGDQTTPHAFYNSTTPFTNEQALKLGEEAAFQLAVHDEDKVCVSITLCHAFGMGSAISSALMMGATIALPAVGGLHGCGVPSERAAGTLEVLQKENCTLLFADTHTLKALPEDPPHDLHLRGGLCKIGSGSDFLEETRKYAGAKLMTMGKKE